MNVSAVKTSYGRCCVNPKFFDRFYEIFLKSNPAIALMFANTNFTKQKTLLRQGLSMMLMHLEGVNVGTIGMKRIGESHSPKHLNITADLYQFWIDSLTKAIAECDAEFNPSLDKEWRQTLQAGVQFILLEGKKVAA